MANWKSKVTDLYRMATLPYRGLAVRSMSQRGQLPIFVLFYHRISDTCPNDWTMRVSDFTQQVDWLAENFDVISLKEVQQRVRNGGSNRPAVALTFDDGYSENGESAIPLLLEKQLPVTYFVTTDHTVNQKHFGHDLERGEPLPPNTIESLRSYAAAGVEIGGHTRTHCDLGKVHDPRRLVDEVLVATREMEDAIGKRIRYFAFPFGTYENLNPVVFQLLKQHGFEGVCSAYGGWNAIGGDAFHMQRIHGDPNFARLKNQLTFDPRLAHVPRYDYSTEHASPQVLATMGEALQLAENTLSAPPLMPQIEISTSGSSILNASEGN